MPDLQALLAAAQGAGVGPPPSGAAPPMGVPSPPMAAAPPMVPPMQAPPTPAGGDPIQMLMSMLGPIAASPQGAPMLQAIQSLMGGAGDNGGGMGMPGDGQYAMGKRLGMMPPPPSDIPNYTGPNMRRSPAPGGFADDALDVPEGTAPGDSAAGRMPGQKNMGAYQNANRNGKDASYAGSGGESDYQDEYDTGSGSGARVNRGSKGDSNSRKPQTTEEELADVQRRMGDNPTDKDNLPKGNKNKKNKTYDQTDDDPGDDSTQQGNDPGDHEYR